MYFVVTMSVSLPFLTYSALNGVIENWVRVAEGYLRWRCSIDHVIVRHRPAIVSILLYCTIFKLCDVE